MNGIKQIATILGIVHDLVCSGLLCVIVLFLIRAHAENTIRLSRIELRLRRTLEQ